MYTCKKRLLLCLIFALTFHNAFAGENLFEQARSLQRSGKSDEAIDAYKEYLTKSEDKKNISDK